MKFLIHVSSAAPSNTSSNGPATTKPLGTPPHTWTRTSPRYNAFTLPSPTSHLLLSPEPHKPAAIVKKKTVLLLGSPPLSRRTLHRAHVQHVHVAARPRGYHVQPPRHDQIGTQPNPLLLLSFMLYVSILSRRNLILGEGAIVMNFLLLLLYSDLTVISPGIVVHFSLPSPQSIIADY